MTTAVLLTDWTVYFSDAPTTDGGHNQLRWTGTTGTTNIKDLYSALNDLMDNNTAGVGDYTAWGAQMRGTTPVSFQIGQIFTNDPDAWFIDPESIKHLTGGGLNSTGWTYSTGVRKGIFRVSMSSLGTIVAGDVGFTASNGTVTGVLLHVDTNLNELWIRPTNNTATHDWSTVAAGTVTVNAHTGTQDAAGITGNTIWSNIFTLGTIVAGTQLYVGQDQAVIANSEDSGAGLWWGTGQLDILVETTRQGTLLDSGYLTVYARLENKLYDNFVTDASAGGRSPVPLATDNDLNNTTVGAIAANGIALGFAGPYASDVDNDTTNEDYSIQLNCASNPLSYVYEYIKYINRIASATSINGLTGDQYIGIDYKLEYTSETGTVNIGDEVTGVTSGATGYVTNKNSTGLFATLNNSQGTFVTGENVSIGGNILVNLTAVTPISPKKQSPLGTFAGGRFFGAPGVYLTNVPGADLNNYEVIADDGLVYAEPVQVTFTLTGIQTDSEIRIYNNDLTTTRDTEITGIENSESVLQSATIINGGTGYSVNDKLTLTGGTFSTAAILNVDTIDGGVITSVSIDNPGAGYTDNPTVPTAHTGGTGSSATFNGTFRGSFSYTYTYTTDINITVVVFDLFSKDIRLTGLSLTTTNQSIPIQQNTERNYLTGSV
jgi:hypothetical protein